MRLEQVDFGVLSRWLGVLNLHFLLVLEHLYCLLKLFNLLFIRVTLLSLFLHLLRQLLDLALHLPHLFILSSFHLSYLLFLRSFEFLQFRVVFLLEELYLLLVLSLEPLFNLSFVFSVFLLPLRVESLMFSFYFLADLVFLYYA